MKKLLAATLLVAIVMLSGCLSALHPLFTEQDLVYDPQLVGSWMSEKGDSRYTFEQGNARSFASLPEGVQKLAGRAYLLTVRDSAGREVRGKYYAFLARIGNGVYLDYFPAETDQQAAYDGIYKMNFLPMHSFYRFRQEGNRIVIRQFSGKYLDQLIKEKRIRLQHEVKLDGSYVITAPTSELQQYVAKYGGNDAAYEDNQEFSRIR